MRLVSLVLFFQSLISGSALAKQGDCQDDMCIAFEVTLNFEGYQNSPLVFGSTGVADVGGTPTSYESIVTRSEYSCTKQVKVLKETYFAMKNVMTSLGGTAGEQPPVMTPLQQQLVAFYVTLMRQTEGFTCSPSDFLESGRGGTISGPNGTTNGTAAQFRRGRIEGFMGDGLNVTVFVSKRDGTNETLAIGDSLYPGCIIIGVDADKDVVIVERDGVRGQISTGQYF